MRSIRRAARGAVAVVGLALVAPATSEGLGTTAVARAAEPSAKEQELLAVLRSAAPEGEKAITCKYLAVHGSAAAVADLAKLLDNPRLSSWARIALEAIPGAEADAALREAAARLTGLQLVGVVNSIGVRRDAGAIAFLEQRLAAEDAEVSAAAVAALGRIGTPGAADVLRQALAGSAARDAVAQACIVCAEQLLADGDAGGALRLYDAVWGAEVSEQRRAEAARGAILARGRDGIPLLVELLRSPTRRLFNMGLFAARELGGDEARREPFAADVDAALVGEIIAARTADSAERGGLLIEALADRHGAVGTVAPEAIRATLIEAAQAGPRPMRLAAVEALGRVGDATVVESLIGVAGDPAFAEPVRRSLAALGDPAADDAIRQRLAGADRAVLPVLVGLVGDRRIAAIAEVVPLADHDSPAVRTAALEALGQIVDLANLEVLIRRIGAGDGEAAERDVAIRALTEASVRMEDREACAAQLAAAVAAAAPADQTVLLDTLGAVGGTKALEALAAAARSEKEAQQDAATRLLGKWMTADAAPVLLGLAQPDAPPRFRTRALRGYLRIARQFVLPDAERAAMCRRALAAATEEVDRTAILEILKRYPGAATLEVAREAMKVPGLEGEARAAAAAIEKKLAQPAG